MDNLLREFVVVSAKSEELVPFTPSDIDVMGRELVEGRASSRY
jgi:hypothetical protein